jgi:hypothetical protein
MVVVEIIYFIIVKNARLDTKYYCPYWLLIVQLIIVDGKRMEIPQIQSTQYGHMMFLVMILVNHTTML